MDSYSSTFESLGGVWILHDKDLSDIWHAEGSWQDVLLHIVQYFNLSP